MTHDLSWISPALHAARAQVMAALLRYFRDLDIAEEAFQEASLRALQKWPVQGPPRDPAAWLILVGRNVAVDQLRRLQRQQPLPDAEQLPDEVDIDLAERLDQSNYQDDLLRLMFVCCHPGLPATQQIALALRLVSGLTVPEIARAFLVSDSAMEQRITRAKRLVMQSGISFETPGAIERSERLAAVASMLYLLFNEGYSASSGAEQVRAALCDEAIRLTRILLQLFATEPEIMALLALMLLQHARTPARLDAQGEIVLLEQQDRSRWNGDMIAEGLAMVDKAFRHQRPGPYQIQAAIAALHDRAATAAETDWLEIELLYQALEQLQPSPVVTLNRAVALAKSTGPAAALTLIEPLAVKLDGYFHFHGVKGALHEQLGQVSAARDSFNRAIALAHTPAEAAHIRLHLDALGAS